MLAYLTATDSFQTDRLFNIIKGTEKDTTGISASDLYDSLVYNNDSSPLLVQHCGIFLNGAKYPDVVDGILEYLPVYCLNGGDEVTGAGFKLLCDDMRSSHAEYYTAVMADLWGQVQ